MAIRDTSDVHKKNPSIDGAGDIVSAVAQVVVFDQNLIGSDLKGGGVGYASGTRYLVCILQPFSGSFFLILTPSQWLMGTPAKKDRSGQPDNEITSNQKHTFR